MSIRTRILIGILLVVSVGFFLFLDWMLAELEPQYRKATEDPLVDSAHVLASIASLHVEDGVFQAQGFREAFANLGKTPMKAKIYDFIKTKVDYRVYVTDRDGKVVFDSDRGRAEGEDYSGWRDVSRTLQGEYGARTSRDLPGNTKFSVMYVGAPIRAGVDIVGVLSVGKPTLNTNEFTEKSKRRIISFGLITIFLVVLVSMFVARMITRPIELLTQYARDVRDGKRVSLPDLPRGEVGELGAAFEGMRDALEGKKYVEQFVQTLTHELKSPLSAIKGAAELLGEEPPADRKKQFLNNIENESARIQRIIERLLMLSAVEGQKTLGDIQRCDLGLLVEQIVQSATPLCESKKISIDNQIPKGAHVYCDEFLVTQAVDNLLGNAIDFSTEGGKISLRLVHEGDSLRVIVEDQGQGIPDYALNKVFDRFYSLQRPGNGKKSTGLGLSFVREVAVLHSGKVTLSNITPSGVRAEFSLPVHESSTDLTT